MFSNTWALYTWSGHQPCGRDACFQEIIRFEQEPAMTPKFNSTKGLAALVVIAAFGLETAHSHAAPKRKNSDRGSVYDYGRGGSNTSYQSGPHTRIYVTRRSWLDAGTELLPGDRKFTDYAFPPGYSFGRENNNRPIDRQPLNPPSDLGIPGRFPRID
jgi:hypothetical protein